MVLEDAFPGHKGAVGHLLANNVQAFDGLCAFHAADGVIGGALHLMAAGGAYAGGIECDAADGDVAQADGLTGGGTIIPGIYPQEQFLPFVERDDGRCLTYCMLLAGIFFISKMVVRVSKLSVE